MTLSVTHATRATRPDSNDGKLSSNAWNEDHKLVGRPGSWLGFGAEGVGEDLDLPDALSPANRLAEFDTPEKRAAARANLDLAVIDGGTFD